ncbi:hypothetical protein OIN59_25265 [Acidovorax sp. D2M1]|uniref:PD-(D/E)XK nuclease superfamily protein n=1 Tax=Acidovorax benzenivorans TaxID=2987520 RepID=A0ABT5S5L7_9BURK|nr:hypothetical protein [Acidovorax benzenivorans]MDD2180741.1 hypothetical protein [Acidovorax benzenivorans]
MSTRNLLRKHIAIAWHRTMEEAYANRLIYNERALQMYFCRRLEDAFGAHRRSVFVEPSFSVPGSSARIPDVVVCNSRRIIGVIELKYTPQKKAQYEKDLDTLRWFASHSEPLALCNQRYKDERERFSKRYELASDAVLCWAGVYAGPREDIEKNAESLGPRFLHLHAITSAECPLEIYPPMQLDTV